LARQLDDVCGQLRDADLTQCLCDRHLCPYSTAIWRSFETISSGFGRFPDTLWSCRNWALLNPPSGPLQWGHSRGIHIEQTTPQVNR
jgi:hypothetical protein